MVFFSPSAMTSSYTPPPIMANMPATPSTGQPSDSHSSENAAPINSGITQVTSTAMPLPLRLRVLRSTSSLILASFARVRVLRENLPFLMAVCFFGFTAVDETDDGYELLSW